MMNNTALAISSFREQSLRDIMQYAKEKFHQAHRRGDFIQIPIPDERNPQLGRAVVSDPNVTPGDFSRNSGRRRPRGILDAYVKTCQRWNLGPDKQMILLGYEPDDVFGLHMLSGHILPPASKDFRDRISYILCIGLGLGTVFNEAVEAELNWLNRTRPELNDKSAFDHMLEGHMSNLFIVANLVEHERGLK